MASDFWLDRPVFVTGGTGLVGAWTVKSLLERGAEVVCLVRDWVPDSELVQAGDWQRVRVVRGDVCDMALVERILGEYEIDTVLHLAAQTLVGVANRNPVSTFETNVAGTWRLLEAARRSPAIRQIVVASSDKAYGDQPILPYDEATPLAGKHPYDVSKSCADLIAQSYAHTYGLPVAITRCGNFFGGGDLNWSRLIPGTLRAICRQESPVIRSDGAPIRDYFYVRDGAASYLWLAEQLAADRALAGQAFNFSSERALSVKDLTMMLLDLAGTPELAPVILGTASNEIQDQTLSAAKARALGWHPSWSLEDALAETLAWYRDHFKVVPVPEAVR